MALKILNLLILEYPDKVILSEPDVKLYKQLTEKGKFYDFLMEQWDISDRREFKDNFFGTIFFSKGTHPEQNKFRTIFPNVWRVIKYFKKRNYKQLPIKLQKVEAELILNVIARRLCTERKGIFFNTIHDSFLCLEQDAEYIKSIIKDEFSKRGINPTLRTEIT